MENIKDLRSTGGTKPVRDSNNNKKLKDSWNCNNINNSSSSNHSYGDEDYLGVFSWPPRSYTCSFCKREFRSAQALGGHMNVHRRDRARLRVQQSPPKDGHQYSFLNLNINPNPNANPNPNFSSPSMNFSPSFTCTLPTVVSSPLSTISSPPSSVSPTEIKKWGKDYGDLVDQRGYPNSPKFKSQDLIEKKSAKSFFREEKGLCKFSKKSEIVRLDLEIGLISDEPNEDLDLELRLGYA